MSDFDIQGARKAGYSDAEIADYLAKQRGFDVAGARKAGYKDAEIVSHLSPADKEPGMAGKVADTVNTGVNWLGTQLTKGATSLLGAPQALGDLVQRGSEWAGEKVGAPEAGKAVGAGIKNQLTFNNILPTTEGLNKLVFKDAGVPEVNAADNPALTLTDPLGFKGKVNVGKMLDAGVQAIPGAMALPGGSILPAVMGGVTSEAAGQATEGTKYEPYARVAGALPGAWLGAKARTPLAANLTEEQQRLVDIAKQQGVPLTVAQETGRGGRIESALSRFPTSAGVMNRTADQQATKIAQLASREAGTMVDNVGPDAMGRVAKNAHEAFETAKKFPENIRLGEDFMSTAGQKLDDYLSNISTADVVPGVGKRVKELQGMVMETPAGRVLPELTNEQYQEFRRGISLALQNTNKPGARDALKGLRTALDDAAEASLPAEKMDAWREARKNWANYKVLSKATAQGTADSRSSGSLSPSALSGALRQSQGVDRFASTTGGMNDIARVSGYLADTMPNSGTPQTLAMQSLLTGGPVGGAYLAGGLPLAGLATAGLAVPNVAARAMTGQGWLTPLGPTIPIRSSWVRNYLANQALPSTGRATAQVPLSLAPNLLTDARARQ